MLSSPLAAGAVCGPHKSHAFAGRHSAAIRRTTQPLLLIEARSVSPKISVSRYLWTALVVVLLALNLRPNIAAIGPLLSTMQADIPLSNTAASLLTTIPIMMIGVGALVGHRIRQVFDEYGGILAGIVVISLGAAMRLVWWSPSGLIITSLIAGVGIALVQVLIPSYIKRTYYGHSARIMGLYTTGIMGGAALGAGAVGMLTRLFGWAGGLAAWTFFGLATTALWVGIHRAYKNHRPVTAPTVVEATKATALQHAQLKADRSMLFKNVRAWELMIFFGINTAAFMLLLAWLPPYYTALGWSLEDAGILLSVYTVGEVLVGLLLSEIIRYFPDRRPLLVTALLGMTAGLLLLIFVPEVAPLSLAALLGVSTGAVFALSLILTMDHTHDPEFAGTLSDFVQGGGYLIAGLMPFAAGLLRDSFDDLRGAWGLMLLGTVVLYAMVLRFRKDTYMTSFPEREMVSSD